MIIRLTKYTYLHRISVLTVEIYNITPESVKTTYDFLIIYYYFQQKNIMV